MENKIIRSIDGNKLVIACNTINYKLKMLESNRIPGLLPLEIKENDGNKELCYDITSRESFGSIGTTRTLKMDDVRGLVYSVHHILQNIEKYLLVPDDLILDKEYIYVCNGDLNPSLCYLPGYGQDFAAGLSTLLQDVLGMVDHNDHEAVVLAYSLYQESLKPGYVIGDLLKILNNENSRIKEPDGREENQREDNKEIEAIGMNTDESPEEKSDRPKADRLKADRYKSDKLNSDRPKAGVFIDYQLPASKDQIKTMQEKDALFSVVNKAGRRRHSTIFSR